MERVPLMVTGVSSEGAIGAMAPRLRYRVLGLQRKTCCSAGAEEQTPWLLG